MMAATDLTRSDLTNSQTLLWTGSSVRPNVILSQQAEEELELPGLHIIHRYKSMHTVWAILVNVAIQVCLLVMIFLLPMLLSKAESSVLPTELPLTSLFVYIHVIVLFTVLALHLYLRQQHNASRRYGYGEFYRHTICLRRLPFYVVLLVTVIISITVHIMNDLHYCHMPKASSDCLWLCGLKLEPFRWLQLIVCVEFIICFPTLIIYLVRTIRFNNSRLTPDVFRESTLSPDTTPVRIVLGYRDKSLVEELLEKQLDQINFLRERCQQLTHEMFLAYETRGSDHRVAIDNSSNVSDLAASLLDNG
jgi:hypothetical protein